MPLGDMYRIIEVVRKAIAQETRSGAMVEHAYGQIASINEDGTVNAYLSGDTEATSEGFRVPGHLHPRVGAKAMFAVDHGRGDKYIVEMIPSTPLPKVSIDINDGYIYTNDGYGQEKALTFLIWEGTEIIFDDNGTEDEFIWE